MSVTEINDPVAPRAARTSPGVLYPSYKSLDAYIDTDALRALNGFLTERIEAHIAAERDDFFLNQHRLDDSSPYQPGVKGDLADPHPSRRPIRLSRS